MAFDYSTTGLLASVRDLTYSGTSLRDWPDDKLLRVINREIAQYLVPMMMGARTNLLATYADTALVASQSAYWLPSKAAGLKARALQIVDSTGAPYASLVEAPLEDAIGFGQSAGSITQGVPSRYYWRGNQVVLWPVPSGTPAGLYLRVYYLNRPSSLVLNSACIQITAISSGASTFTLSFAGTIPSGYANTTLCDLVQNLPGFDVLQSLAITSQTASSVTFTGTVSPQLLVGDWVCVSDTAPVVTGAIPEVVVGCLISKVAMVAGSGKMSLDQYNILRGIRKEDEKRAEQFLNRRNTGNAPVAGGGALYRFTGAGWSTT